MKLRKQIFTGKEIKELSDSFGKIRLQTFKQFPYLYEGTIEGERKYAEEYSSHPQSCLIGFFDKDRLVGFVTGTPVNSGLDIVADIEKLLSVENDANDFYYIGEMIILPEYRSFANSSQLFKYVEDFALDHGFAKTCFMTVKRENNHSLKPKNYKSLEPLWKFHQYKKTNFTVRFKWQTFVEENKSEKIENELEIWVKDLNLC